MGVGPSDFCVGDRSDSRLVEDNTLDIHEVYNIDEKTVGEGEGGVYGSTARARKKATGQEVAVQTKNHGINPAWQKTMAEIAIRMSLKHPNVIELIETFQGDAKVFFVLELAIGGCLSDRVTQQGKLVESGARRCMDQILRAVKYCHEQNVCIRCLDPENIVAMNTNSIHEIVLKLTIFDLSRRFDPGEVMTTISYGTPDYVAPQVLAERYDSQCDLWSSGVIMYFLLDGKTPFRAETDTDAEVLEKVRVGNFSYNRADWAEVSKAGKDLVKSLVRLNPDKRLTAAQALQDAWFENK